jgi:uncharacterized protein
MRITLCDPARLRKLEAMKLTDETLAGINLVRAHSPGEIRVGETVIRHSCLLRADRLVQWRPRTLDALTLEDLEPIFELQPEIVVLGTGTRQRFPDAKLLGSVLARGIGCEVMNTAAACRTYNVLVSEDRPVVAALLLQDD